MTGAPQDASRIIASSDCCYRLERFARDLVKLCAKYDFHVHAEPDGDIGVIDKLRRTDVHYPAVAFFNGVDEYGLYNTINSEHRKDLGMLLAERE